MHFDLLALQHMYLGLALNLELDLFPRANNRGCYWGLCNWWLWICIWIRNWILWIWIQNQFWVNKRNWCCFRLGYILLSFPPWLLSPLFLPPLLGQLILVINQPDLLRPLLLFPMSWLLPDTRSQLFSKKKPTSYTRYRSHSSHW